MGSAASPAERQSMSTSTEQITTGPAAGSGLIAVRCPADGKVVGAVPDMAAAQVHEMATALRAAQPEWEDLGTSGRAKRLLRFLDWVLDNEGRLIGIIEEETGKSWGDAEVETAVVVDTVNYFTGSTATGRKIAVRAGERERIYVQVKAYGEFVGKLTECRSCGSATRTRPLHWPTTHRMGWPPASSAVTVGELTTSPGD